MKNPHSKNVEFHPDAQKTYDNKIDGNEQLRSVFDGLKWLITNNYKIGKIVRDNYRVIKSYEDIPAWHKDTFDLESLPSILILYSFSESEDKIVIEGINITDST